MKHIPLPGLLLVAVEIRIEAGKCLLGCNRIEFLRITGRILAYDHKHRHASDKGVPYEFQDAYQLLIDFFADVDRVLKEVKK